METYTIRQVSELFGLPASTLRYYEEMGILTNVEKNASGHRVYSSGHINRLRTISCFKRTGMSIAQLQKFFGFEADEPNRIGDILALLEEQERHVADQIAELQQDQTHVRRKLCYYRAIQTALQQGTALPHWGDYRDCSAQDLTPENDPSK